MSGVSVCVTLPNTGGAQDHWDYILSNSITMIEDTIAT